MPVIMPRDLENIEEWLKILEKITAKNRENLSKEDFERMSRCLEGLTKSVREILY